MPEMTLTASVPVADPGAVLDRLADFACYPDYTTAVRDVEVKDLGDGVLLSAWAVNFDKGVLHWKERDHIDRTARRLSFRQTEGDFAEFSGSWQVSTSTGGSTVTFTASFDLGVGSLAPMLDPVAERALRDNILLILQGLFGTAEAR